MIESKGSTVYRMNLVEAWQNHEKNPRSSRTFFQAIHIFMPTGAAAGVVYSKAIGWAGLQAAASALLLLEKSTHILPHGSIKWTKA